MLKYLVLILKVGFRILWDFTFYVWRYARHPERTPLEKRYKKAREIIIYTLKAYRIRLDVQNIQNLREAERSGKCFLLVSNHLSDLDPLMVIAFSERPISFIAKKEIRKFPFIGAALRSIDGIFMDRSDLRQSVSAMRLCAERIKSGYCSYAIYPEGTRNREPEGPLPEYHPGSFEPAFRSGSDIVCLAIYGTQRPFHASADYPSCPVEFDFFDYIKADELKGKTTIEAAEEIHARTAAIVSSFVAFDKEYFAKGLHKTRAKPKDFVEAVHKGEK